MRGALFSVRRGVGLAQSRCTDSRSSQVVVQRYRLPLEQQQRRCSADHATASLQAHHEVLRTREESSMQLRTSTMPYTELSNVQDAEEASQKDSLLSLIRESDMSAHTLARFIAEERSSVRGTGRARTYDEVFEFLPTKEREEIRSLVDQIVLHNKNEWLPLVWTSWINAIAHCRDWDEFVEELKDVSFQRPSASDQDAFVNNTIWPASVLQRALERIRTREQLEEATKLVKILLPDMRLKLALQTVRRLDVAVHVQHEAKHLSASMTDLIFDAAERCLALEDDVVPMVVTAPSGEFVTYSVLRRHLYRLMIVADGRTQRQAMRVIEWATRRLSIDLVDRLRMQVLRVTLRGEDFSIDETPDEVPLWRTIQWAMPVSRPFANAGMAKNLLRELYQNGRAGVSFTFALRAAMQIAVTETNKSYASQLFTCIQDYLLDRSRLHVPSLLGVDLLEFFSLHKSEKQAWQLFQHILNERDPDLTIRDWSVVVGWAARNRAIPVDEVLQLAQIEKSLGSTELQSSQTLPYARESGIKLNEQAEILSALMSNFIKRGDPSGFDGVLRIWKDIERSKVPVNGACLAHYCRALTFTQRSEEAVALLEKLSGLSIVSSTDTPEEQHGILLPNVTPDEEMFHLLMLTMIGQAQPKKAFELFKAMRALKTIIPSSRTLELLQRAANDASQLLYDIDAAHPLLSSLFSRLSRGMQQEQIESVAIWDGQPAAVVARKVVRDCLFEYRPELLKARNPLDTVERGDGLFWRNEVRAHNAGTWLHEQVRALSPFALSAAVPKTTVDSSPADEKLLVAAKHTKQHLTRFVFSPWLFHQYLRLLPFVAKSAEARKIGEQALWEERFLVLAWMRALDVRPLPQTLCLICTYLDEILPPAADSGEGAAASHATGPLSAYLTDWLGKAALPTFNDVLRYVRVENWEENR